MSHKIAKRIRKNLRELGVDPNFTKYNYNGITTLAATCGSKVYKEASTGDC